MTLYIKNMVSQRCKIIVAEMLKRLGLQYSYLDLGSVEILKELNEKELNVLQRQLQKTGLELLDDKKGILIEKIKAVIIEMIHYSDDLPKTNYSVYISQKVNYNYTYLANIFMESNGITIQQFIIKHKVEKIKELILYKQLNLTEIAFQLQYSSVAHLSNQFKKETGLSPSFYKKLNQKRKMTLEKV
jgi:YesN/AraC family two-component response regulator